MKSPSLIIWYLVQKEAEIKNLRMIFKYMFDRHPLESAARGVSALAIFMTAAITFFVVRQRR